MRDDQTKTTERLVHEYFAAIEELGVIRRRSHAAEVSMTDTANALACHLRATLGSDEAIVVGDSAISIGPNGSDIRTVRIVSKF